MKTVHLFQFKESITSKVPFFNDKYQLQDLNDLMQSDLMNTEKVTEYIIDVPDDFMVENTPKEDLLRICLQAKDSVVHHFVTTLNDDDVL